MSSSSPSSSTASSSPSNPRRNATIAVLSVLLGIILCFAVFFLIVSRSRWKQVGKTWESVKAYFWGASRAEEGRTELGASNGSKTPSLIGHDPFRPPSTPPRPFNATPSNTPPGSSSPTSRRPLASSSSSPTASSFRLPTKDQPRPPSSISNTSNSTSFLQGTRPVSFGRPFEIDFPDHPEPAVASSAHPFENPAGIILAPLPKMEAPPPSSWGRYVGREARREKKRLSGSSSCSSIDAN